MNMFEKFFFQQWANMKGGMPAHSFREEKFELRLINENENDSTFMRLRAHRDELISLENELGEKLQLKSDGSLFKTPI